jgi:hypothetical protein
MRSARQRVPPPAERAFGWLRFSSDRYADEQFHGYLIREGKASILSEGAAKQQLGSGKITPLIKELAIQDRDLLLLMTDGAWTRFSIYLLAQIVMKNLANLAGTPRFDSEAGGQGRHLRRHDSCGCFVSQALSGVVWQFGKRNFVAQNSPHNSDA